MENDTHALKSFQINPVRVGRKWTKLRCEDQTETAGRTVATALCQLGTCLASSQGPAPKGHTSLIKNQSSTLGLVETAEIREPEWLGQVGPKGKGQRYISEDEAERRCRRGSKVGIQVDRAWSGC